MTPSPLKLAGMAASQGAAIGRVFLLADRRVQEPHRHLEPPEIEAEVARLQDALARSDQQLAEILSKLAGHPSEHALIIEAHRLMLSDPALSGAAESLIREEFINAEWAIRRVVKTLSAAFDALEDPYFRERQADIGFVGERVIKNLLGMGADLREAPPEGVIVVAHELSPADAMLLFASRRVAGIVTEAGGRTSHTAIVARAMEVPAVVGVEGLLEQVGNGDLIALEGSSGLVVLHPSETETLAFLQARERHEAREKQALATRELEARTLDGHRVLLRANIELVEEVPSLLSHGADGIGLYRTEFLYLNRRTLPDEEEQYATYRALLEAVGGQLVTIRTFDLGSDKSREPSPHEEANPALGLRAIRYCLAHPEMFLTQLRALWRASAHGSLRVMLPMVSGLGELRAARRLWNQAREEVLGAGHPVADEVPLGIMVETPAAVALADRLARESDFFSIGTNDLVQYALAVDRGNPEVGAYHTPVHPALLRLLLSTLEAGREAGIPVSICGEMAGEPNYALLLLGLGVSELSMSGTSIPAVKHIIRCSRLAEGEELLQTLLALDTAEEVEACLQREMSRRFPGECAPPASVLPF